MTSQIKYPRYGIDAPGLVCFFFIAGTVSLTIFLLVLLSFFQILGQTLTIIISVLLGIIATYLLGMGCFMIYGSKVMKLADRDKLLDLVQWSGDEIVLDVGCGRGLMLVGAAKRLTTGKAIGIDLWQQQDQADNSPAEAPANATIEGVTDRVEIKRGDMRELPFPENYFNVVVSSWTIHNLEVASDRQKALSEIIRVLKPGGVVAITDIVNQTEYVAYFKRCGMTDVQLHNNPIRDIILKIVSFGSFAPSAVSARKVSHNN